MYSFQVYACSTKKSVSNWVKMVKLKNMWIKPEKEVQESQFFIPNALHSFLEEHHEH
jgi:hypothetical protein